MMRAVLSLVWFLTQFNEVDSHAISRMRVRSRTFAQSLASLDLQLRTEEEITATMTKDMAVATLAASNITEGKAELMNFLETKFGTPMRSLRATQPEEHLWADSTAHVSAVQTAKTNPTGYSALDKATDMLNAMAEETQASLEKEEFRCGSYDDNQLVLLDNTRTKLLACNADAAEAQSRVLDSMGKISTFGETLTTTKEDFVEHKRVCKSDIKTLKSQLVVVRSDIQVMARILQLTDCKKLLLFQCKPCGGSVMIQHDEISDLIGTLESNTAKQYVDHTLELQYKEAVKISGVVSLAQDDVEHIIHQGHYSTKGPVNVSDVPKITKRASCVPNNKCSLSSSPNCQKLKDRFLMVQAGIVDKKNELKEALNTRKTECGITSQDFSQQISSLNKNIREQRTRLAVATQDVSTAQSGSHQASAQHAKMDKEYHHTMKVCCTNQNNAKSEICAMTKIRGELLKMEGQKIFITDCAVSEWRTEECTTTCGGGTMRRSRAIIVHKIGSGMKCPPLAEVVPCNDHLCPIDCEMSDWQGWSACGAECGGGVRERSRTVTTDMENGGTPCDSTENAEACNLQSCDADCVPDDWTAWSACPKSCNKGHQDRTRGILVPARGTGTCPPPGSEFRRQFKKCNDFSCDEIMANATTLKCVSMVDIIILMDGSGSLRTLGWKQTLNLSRSLVQNMEGGSNSVKVAVQLFSGPKTWPDYALCTGETQMPTGETINLKETCGISWVSHFTDDLTALDTTMEQLEWPASSTLTSVALGEAASEMMNGRKNASTVVIVITDGKPMSQTNTIAAAQKLSETAKILWIPIGANAPIDLINDLAEEPKDDHIIRVTDFADLSSPDTVNAILVDACPIVER